jgi:hypothetical protein
MARAADTTVSSRTFLKREEPSTMRRKFRLLAVVAVMAVLATGAYAFTAANTVPETNAGFGGAAISGYAVSDVHYTLGENAECESTALPDDENNFGNCVTGVDFTLSSLPGDTANAPTDVTVHFAGPDPENLPPHLYSAPEDCTITANAGAWDVECNILEFAASIEFLRIAAAQ